MSSPWLNADGERKLKTKEGDDNGGDDNYNDDDKISNND